MPGKNILGDCSTGESIDGWAGIDEISISASASGSASCATVDEDDNPTSATASYNVSITATLSRAAPTYDSGGNLEPPAAGTFNVIQDGCCGATTIILPILSNTGAVTCGGHAPCQSGGGSGSSIDVQLNAIYLNGSWDFYLAYDAQADVNACYANCCDGVCGPSNGQTDPETFSGLAGILGTHSYTIETDCDDAGVTGSDTVSLSITLTAP